MLTHDPSHWGTLSCLDENILDQIMNSVKAHVVRAICKDGRSVVNARANCRRNALARGVEGAEDTWDAYEVVCVMAERAVKTTDSLTVTVHAAIDFDTLFEMLNTAFGMDVDCNPHTHTIIFSGVIVLVSTDDYTGYSTFMAHCELQYLYDISHARPDNWNDLSDSIVQVLDLYLEYTENPQGIISMSMNKFATELVPRRPVLGELWDYGFTDSVTGDKELPHMGYAVFWKDGPVFCLEEKKYSISVFRTPQFPSLSPWPFQMGGLISLAVVD